VVDLLPTLYRSHHYGVGTLLLHAALWSMVRRAVDVLPIHVVLLVLAVVVAVLIVRWLWRHERAA
jgi:uncharacterized membrane protein